MKHLAVALCLSFFLPLVAQATPDSYNIGNRYICKDGYKRKGNYCVKFSVPLNAHVLGNMWVCNEGYKRKGNRCNKLNVPSHAHVLGNMWVCNDGYKKKGNQCVELQVPANAHALGSMWVCNDGYRRQNNKCTKIKVPSNAHIIGNSWTCNTGFRRKNNTCVAMTAKEKAQMQAYIKKYKQGQLSHQDYVAYKSEVDSEANGVLKLRNGAIIEHTGYSYLGYIGYQEDIVLFGSGRTCKFWINGNVFECDLLRSPPARHGRPASEIYISDVRGNGSILIGGDGALYEVSSLDTITTSLWFGGFDALLIDGDELINFDEDEIVSVSRIR